ncbi:hypothetical protein [Verrucosispora sp. WMMD1129]|uniref:hypothetical protein n=1 Tax=Verrucosispora sp. WMMD1129 TaxID=3016093 RepID=UPI00249C3F9B|nr:hypothetical protein [Verrucosispora sp. WMMD1129]WFE47582.1 hypothetical protein O7624_26305 [Verrucosispora sp. WMMD1129]
MRRGPRSARLLTGHRRPPAAQSAYRPGGPVVGVGPHTWAALNVQGRAVGRARVVTLPPAQVAAFRRRVWAWRLLLAGWTGLTGLAAWATLWRIGPAALTCLAPMLAVLVLLASCASSDLREQEDELRQGR